MEIWQVRNGSQSNGSKLALIFRSKIWGNEDPRVEIQWISIDFRSIIPSMGINFPRMGIHENGMEFDGNRFSSIGIRGSSTRVSNKDETTIYWNTRLFAGVLFQLQWSRQHAPIKWWPTTPWKALWATMTAGWPSPSWCCLPPWSSSSYQLCSSSNTKRDSTSPFLDLSQTLFNIIRLYHFQA